MTKTEKRMTLVKKAAAVILFVCVGAVFLPAREIKHETKLGAQFAYYFDDHEGAESDNGFELPDYSPEELPEGYVLPAGDEGRDLGNGFGSVEFKTFIDHSITVPVLTGSGPLTKGNSVKFSFRGNLAPVIASVEAKAVLTPVAFLNFETGFSLGTGWHALGFNGIGLNKDGDPEEDSFPGAVTETWLGATFQFDLAAVYPGEWNHAVVLANAKFKHSHFSAAEDKEPWQWEADAGENFNGWEFLGTYVLGYQMPLKLNMIALMLETEQYIGSAAEISPMDEKGGWGSDFVKLRFGPLANIKFSEDHSLTVLLQLKTLRGYTEDTIHCNYFMNRDYDSGYLEFHRLALAYQYKLF